MNRSTLTIATALSLATAVCAGTFTETFSAGVRDAYWTIEESVKNVYGWDVSTGKLKFWKYANNPSSLNHIMLVLNMNAFGGKIDGDFDMSVDLSDVVFFSNAGGYQQLEMHTNFADGSYFFDVYSPEAGGPYAAHVWDGAFRGLVKSAATEGVFRIARQGSTLAGYWSGTQIFAKTSTSALTVVRLVLQNNAGNNSNISCSYDNFVLSGPNVVDRVSYVSGRVVLSDFVGDVASRTVDLRFEPVGGGDAIVKTGVHLDGDGRFATYVYGIGDATPYIVSSGFLRRALATVSLPGGGGALTGLDATLVNGDVDGDNAVTVFDYNALSEAFDTAAGDGKWNPNADLDGDGAVTVYDYNILSASFDSVGD